MSLQTEVTDLHNELAVRETEISSQVTSTKILQDKQSDNVRQVGNRDGSSFLLRVGGSKFDKKIFYCKGAEGPAPGEIFYFQWFSHAM